MKILVLSNLYPPDVIGGYELGCRQAVDALLARGHDVQVLTSAPRSPQPSESHVHRRLQLTDVWNHYLFEKRLPLNSHLLQAQSHRVNAFNIHATLDTLHNFQPDVVYLWMTVGLGGLGLLACLQHLAIPWVWHLMDDVPKILCDAASTTVPAFVNTFNHLVEGSYILCSRQLGDEVEHAGFQLKGHIEIIPNWVTTHLPSPRQHYLQQDRLRILSAAGLVDRRGGKGLDLLAEAAALLRDRGRTCFEIDLFGHVADQSIPELLKRLEIEHLVHLKGNLPQRDLTQLMPGYDLFAFPTRPREPFGFAPLEAAATGCIPVISQTCGLAEWLVHGVHTIKAPQTAHHFAAVFEAALNRQIDLHALGRRAASATRADFSLDNQILRIENVLQYASKKSRSPAGTADEAYRLALLAEHLTQVLLQEHLLAG